MKTFVDYLREDVGDETPLIHLDPKYAVRRNQGGDAAKYGSPPLEKMLGNYEFGGNPSNPPVVTDPIQHLGDLFQKAMKQIGVRRNEFNSAWNDLSAIIQSNEERLPHFVNGLKTPQDLLDIIKKWQDKGYGFVGLNIP
jgi:hypothetical protein